MDHTARVWDLRTGKVLRVLEGHTGMLGTGAYSADGATIVTTSADRTVRFWSADPAAPPRVLTGHGAEVISVALAPDGDRFITGGLDGTATIWRFRRADEAVGNRPPPGWDPLVERVRKRVTRELTPKECRDYLRTADCPPPVKLP